MRREQERQVCYQYMHMSIWQTDEAAMAESRATHSEHVVAKLEYYAQLAAKQAAAAAAASVSSSAKV
jgi:hypothetical protein